MFWPKHAICGEIVDFYVTEENIPCVVIKEDRGGWVTAEIKEVHCELLASHFKNDSLKKALEWFESQKTKKENENV